MLNLEFYNERIRNAKSPIKESLIIAAEIGVESLNSILGHAIEIGDIKVAQAVFSGMRVSLMHEVSLMQKEALDSPNIRR